ncbi:MAG TPA: peptide chain release factor-like protein [Myxococcaceae bacterium]|jgi:protein subunit release factor A|nr:peptide chain release factor-like protein [Myxococcaceae bacterium]
MEHADPQQRRLAAAAALALDDEALLRACEVSTFIGGGPGGQHRNKTASAVRLVHLPTGVTVTATERRSQLRNRSAALERLRAVLTGLARVRRPRRPTVPSRTSKERRIEAKKRTGRRKAERRDRGGW